MCFNTYRNSSRTGEKRRVSFNKELYIRYRTTSEESSSSTLKVKKNKIKANCNTHWTKRNVSSQQDEKFDKLLNKNCSWSYRSPKIIYKGINMEVSDESNQSLNSFSDKIPQDKNETVLDNELPEENKYDYCSTSTKTDLKQSVQSSLQRDARNESDWNKNQICTKADNEFSNEEFEYGNVNKEVQLQPLYSSNKEYNEQNINTIFNESAASNNSSSDEEVLQTRFPVQNEDECNSPRSSLSCTSISNKESITENYSEIKKPLIIHAKAHNKEGTVDSEFNDSSSETNRQAEKDQHQDVNKQIEKNELQDTKKNAEKNEHHDLNKQAKNHERKDIDKQAEENEGQKVTTDEANSLNVEADNSNIETESSYRQNPIKIKNTDMNFGKIKNRSEISPEEKRC